MASPQCEDGYLRIANEIIDVLIRQGLSGQEFRIVLLIIRKTYGFNKKEDAISLTQMAKIAGLSKIRCSQVINSLQLKKIVTVTENINGLTKKYRFNKDFEEWTTVKENLNRIEKVKETVKEKCNHKRQYTKDNIYLPPEILELTNFFADKVKDNNPRNISLLNGKREKTVQRWAKDIEKLHRIDKQSLEDIRAVVEWCQRDSFWKTNILSSEALRKQWDRLYLQMKADEKRNKKEGHLADQYPTL